VSFVCPSLRPHFSSLQDKGTQCVRAGAVSRSLIGNNCFALLHQQRYLPAQLSVLMTLKVRRRASDLQARAGLRMRFDVRCRDKPWNPKSKWLMPVGVEKCPGWQRTSCGRIPGEGKAKCAHFTVKRHMAADPRMDTFAFIAVHIPASLLGLLVLGVHLLGSASPHDNLAGWATCELLATCELIDCGMSSRAATGATGAAQWRC